MLAAQDAVAYLLIDEGWTLEYKLGDLSETDEKELMKRGTEARRDERVEIVMFIAENQNEFVMAVRNIIRPPHGKAKLGPLRFADAGTYQGRMVGMLPRGKGKLQ